MRSSGTRCTATMQYPGSSLSATEAASSANSFSLHVPLRRISKPADCVDSDGIATSTHRQGNPRHCHKCGRLFLLSRDRLRHEKTCVEYIAHHGPPQTCTFCSKEFSLSIHLARHIRVAHKDRPQIRLDEAYATLKKQSSFWRFRRPQEGESATLEATKLDHHLDSRDGKQPGIVGGREPFSKDQVRAHASEPGNAPDCSDPNLLSSHKSRRTSRANSPEWQIPWRYDPHNLSSFIDEDYRWTQLFLHMDEDEYSGYGSETAQSHTNLTECQLAPNVADPSSTSMSRNQLTLRDLTPGQSKPYFPSRDTADHGFAQSPRTAATAKDSKIEGSENVFGAGYDLTGNSRRPPNSPQFNFDTSARRNYAMMAAFGTMSLVQFFAFKKPFAFVAVPFPVSCRMERASVWIYKH